ncbi:copper transporter [Microbacterium sp. CH12i]|uniref:cytochrome c oxidase assembly protein n=1 Tax=Microbacterium sp. CH12i TaxID=1479651 RepID=UPI000461E333|nr:cytochrome c oxidase assembly protein [Microbacterium sp. CH12i]KDA04542.1 copper transporter [Microbacterium sp. CH12i]
MNSAVLRVTGPTILVLAAVIAVAIGLMIGGGAAPRFSNDPGTLVRWGLPFAKLLVNLCGAVMVGTLVLALYGLKAGTKPFNLALNVASAGAAVLTVASGTVAFLTFLSSFNPEVNLGAEFGAQLGRFLLDTELGRAWLITTVLAAGVTLLAFAVRGQGPVIITTILALITLVPMATQGHSGELANHDAAVMSLILHVISAAVWLGGLTMLVIVRPVVPQTSLADLLNRYSTLALVAFIVVAVSGYARALTAIGRWEDLTSPYGLMLLAKIFALLLMGALGALYRRRLIAKAASGGGAFWVFVCVELAFMGIASGAAAALARTAAPADTETVIQTTAAEILNEAPLPPELTLGQWFTAWNPDLLWVLLTAFGVFFYIAGVRRMRRREMSWPVRRTVSWIAAMGLLLWVTSGPIAVYDDYLMSVRLLSLCLLILAIPLLLVGGAPLTLAVNAIHPRNDDTQGIREWLLQVAQSPVKRLALHPVFTAALFAGSLWLIHYTGLLRWSLYDQLGYEWLVTHLLVVGCLFVTSLFRVGGSMPRVPNRWILGTLIVLTLTSTLFAVISMTRSDLMVSEWFGAMGRTWGLTPLQDQFLGGTIALSIGATLAIVTIAVIIRRNQSPTPTPIPASHESYERTPTQ